MRNESKKSIINRRNIWLKKAREIYGDKYDYSEVIKTFRTMNEKGNIICPKHGVFSQELRGHLRGFSCPKCAKSQKLKQFLKKARKVHGDKYNYSEVIKNFTNIRNKHNIICSKHGIFLQGLHSHLQGFSCPKCGRIKRSKSLRISSSTLRKNFIRDARLVHGNQYDYSKVSYIGKQAKDKVCIICPKYGEFWQTYGNHVTLKHKHPLDHINRKKREFANSQPMRLKEFLRTARRIHNDEFKYPFIENEFKHILSKITVTCPRCGNIKQIAHNHVNGHGCKYCKRSYAEKQIFSWIKSILPIGTKIIANDRRLIKPKELDIYIPSYKVAIEFGAAYFHSEEAVGKKYHAEKQRACESKGVKLITFFDADWNQIKLRKIIKSRIKSDLKLLTTKVHARKCIIKRISSIWAKKFLQENHLQGYSHSDVRLGLIFEDRLVCLITFKEPRFSPKYEWELIRFCCERNTIVMGGFSRLFKCFIDRHQPKSIISYADLRFGTGDVYKQVGFRLSHRSQPCPWYTHITGNKFHHRLKMQKHRLSQIFENFDENETAAVNIRKNKYLAVYDCGNNVWIWKRMALRQATSKVYSGEIKRDRKGVERCRSKD